MDSIDLKEFKKFIGDVDLIDLGYGGSRFIWCNNWLGASRVWKWIDRMLATVA